jgi:hypothetical protein
MKNYTDGPSEDPVIRKVQLRVLELERKWVRKGGLKNPEKCIGIRREHHHLMNWLQEVVELPPRTKRHLKQTRNI